MRIAPLLLALASLVGCAKSEDRAVQPSADSTKAVEEPNQEAALPRSIGGAWIEEDGTLYLQLRAEGRGGAIGDALLTYKPDHPEYQEVLDHIGGLEPGESKPVPPWPPKE